MFATTWPGSEATGLGRFPSTPTSISIPATNSSTITFSSCRRASATAASSSLSALTFEIPTEEPMLAGLTKTGYPNGFVTGSPSRSATWRATGIPAPRMSVLKTSLSMHTDEASTPGPT